MNPQISDTRVSRSLQLLLRGLIDYAGLFPPAGLGMPAAVTNYDQYLRSEHAWMLGRFIVPAVRLHDFEEAMRQLPPDAARRWGLSVLLGNDAGGDVASVRAFSSKKEAVVESVEAKVSTAEDVKRLRAMTPDNVSLFCEVPLNERERECISAVAECGAQAKIRTGGETADKFPTPAQVVEFVKLCLGAKVPFKATAGLHHPLRSVHRLTYLPDSDSALMHGFLNVFLAAAFLQTGMTSEAAIELLEEGSPKAIRFTADGITWRGHEVKEAEIAAARQGFSISFGSCSFTEPVADLQSLGLL